MANLEEHGCAGDLSDISAYYILIQEKLPASFLKSYKRWLQLDKSTDNFSRFASWLSEEAVNERDAQEMSGTCHRESEERKTWMKPRQGERQAGNNFKKSSIQEEETMQKKKEAKHAYTAAENTHWNCAQCSASGQLVAGITFARLRVFVSAACRECTMDETVDNIPAVPSSRVVEITIHQCTQKPRW